MSEKIPARFRKTKTGKWAVMAPAEDLEKALAADGKVDVLKKSGDWSKFTVASLGRPFDVDGVQMCYGYAPGDEDDAGGGPDGGRGAQGQADRGASNEDRGWSAGRSATPPPPVDPTEPLPEYQGGAEDEYRPEF